LALLHFTKEKILKNDEDKYLLELKETKTRIEFLAQKLKLKIFQAYTL